MRDSHQLTSDCLGTTIRPLFTVTGAAIANSRRAAQKCLCLQFTCINFLNR